MSQIIRWGILGCGRIARKFASDLRFVEGAVLEAVASRDEQNAHNFAEEFKVPKYHSSYQALVENSNIDVIYIATPHSFHCQHTLLCLHNNKAVLCEKPFAINSIQTLKMIELAKEKNIFLMEAMWSKFLPHYQKVQEMIREGLLGKVKSALINFGFKPLPPIPARLFDPSLGGGSIMDIGIYNVFWAISVLGKPDAIQAIMTPASTGVDEQCSVTFQYHNGALAQLYSSFNTNLATEADISGTEGRIRLLTRFYEPSTTIEYYTGRIDSKKIISVKKEEGFGYQYQARHVCDCLRKGLRESPVMSHNDSIYLMEILDEIRKKAGIKYPADKAENI